MFFPKAISLLLLASVATGRPLAKPEPQTITISYAEIVELENYVQSECNSIQTTATNGWNVFQSVNNNFQGSFYNNFESAMTYYGNTITQSIQACGQLVLMLNVASQTYDAQDNIGCGDFCA